MGYNQSKEKEENAHNTIAVAKVEMMSNQMELKINYLGIGMIVVGVLLAVFLCFLIRAKCKQRAQAWLEKAVNKVPLTSVRAQVPENQAVKQPTLY